ncbi:uncharacterized protein LOC121718606 [Alosa sapidissima]|uniref:uncharacterized protein LOC121718606 n=1 Tax=Alosa sapidissima TaxID=34773 RepID=UPI001C07EF46|nr:uncharacterized protein LOC121718606 [Alosa sapidissima]
MSISKRGACCSVVGCCLRPGTNLLSQIKVYRFPKENVQRDAWIAAVKRDGWIPTSNSRICSIHFISGKPSNDPLSPDYAPTLLPHNQKQPQSHTNSWRDNSGDHGCTVCLQDYQSQSHCDISVGTDLCMTEIDNLQKENAALKDKVETLEKQLQALLGEKAELGLLDLNNDKIIHFHTGLPSSKVFFTLLTFLTTAWIPSSTLLTPALQFYLVLMKLRLGLTHTDLSYRFHCSVGTVSAVFQDWLNVMAHRLKCLIHWPTKQEVQNNLPAMFKCHPFDSVRCIIDCSEVFVDRPTSLDARALTYSNYKSHNTIKFLIAVSPTGAVTFVSKAWGGRASDRVITQSSKLEEGDIVLADRGFNFPQYFSSKGMQLLIPASTRGRTQLSGAEVTRSRQISRVRIHVERAIGRIKNYRILHNTLPVSLVKGRLNDSMSTIDKIILVCSALSNLDKPLVRQMSFFWSKKWTRVNFSICII